MSEFNRKLVNMYDLITCVTKASDLVNPKLAQHHQRVAYAAYRIGEELELPESVLRTLILAGILHDVGALSYNERMELIENEPPSAQDHGFRGARLIETFEPLAPIADIIRHHHLPWNYGEGASFLGRDVSYLSHIIHLADRIVTSIDYNNEVLGQVKAIIDKIRSQKDMLFIPEHVDAFLRISNQENLWLDLVHDYLDSVITDLVMFETLDMDMNGIMELTKIFANIIDFRSPFTANHTAGVAKTAERLAQLAGFSEDECKMMLVAGYLHDLGKLAIPNEVLEKPSGLNEEEFNVIRSHSYYTYRLLQPIREFELINIWASFHHEKLNGTGYPFKLKDNSIPLGARIMAVADIFTAITEDRPYRKGMTDKQTIRILTQMVENRSICPFTVAILLENFDEINQIRVEAQRKESMEYHYFIGDHTDEATN